MSAPAYEAPAQMAAPRDILPSGGNRPERTGRRSQRWALPVALVTVVALLGAGAAVAYGALSGGGAQPESVVPASAFGFAKVDFDPAAEQKIAVLRLSRHFPSVHGNSIDDLRDSILRPMVERSGGSRYDATVRPWVGQRAGVAGWVDAGGRPQALVVLQYTDADKARRGLAALAGEHRGYALSGGYAVIAESQRVADEALAAARTRSLGAGGTYRSDVASLHGNQLVTAWVDLPSAVRAAAAVGGTATSGLTGGLVDASSGRLVLGVRAEATFLQMAGHTVGAASAVATARPGPAAGRLLTNLPDGTAAALAMGSSSALTEAAQKIAGVRSGATEAGPHANSTWTEVLGNLPALLGDGAVLAVGSVDAQTPSGGLRTHAKDPAATTRAYEAFSKLLASVGLEARTQPAPGGDVVLGVGPGYAAALATGGRLGQGKRFQQAMGTLPAGPAAALYVDVTKVSGGLGLSGTSDLKAVQTIGGWVGIEAGQPSFQLRVVVGG